MYRPPEPLPPVVAALLIAVLGRIGPGAAATLEIGQAAPNFCLPGVDGKEHCLKDFAEAAVLVVVFTCNHCPTAQAYEGRIKKLVEDYGDKGVAFVAISPNDPKALRLDELGYTDVSDSLEDMKIRAKRESFNFPYLYDSAKPEGVTSRDTRNAVDAALAKRPVPVPSLLVPGAYAPGY